MIDMETGVINEIKKSPLKDIFEHDCTITDVYGSGNNWATGNLYFGRKHEDDIRESFRRAVEPCDYLQSFFLCHSMGGGTGSGLCTFVTKLLADEYPEVSRLVTSVFPSQNDDVITSPYNTILALNELTEYADCVFPIDNEALTRITQSQRKEGEMTKAKTRAKSFDEMNNIVGNMLLDLTSSARFSGSMNVDLMEISMNMVPFPKLHYLVTSMSPMSNCRTISKLRSMDQMFSDVCNSSAQLTCVEPAKHCYLASGVLVRGKCNLLELRKNIDKLHKKLTFVPWNQDGWKVGHCYAPPLNMESSILNFSNNTGINSIFQLIKDHFQLLYKRRAHLHHYTSVDGFELSRFEEVTENLDFLIKQYKKLEGTESSISANIQMRPIQIAD
ncbi:Tubulin epsilon chain [Cichlidogyrus casuarinus]|uniref:Tubulin epsilon chain n=1 Tax=Cichlidogyrus casuarinus TaxID=1844966 RepID=A0ABD2QMV0_9PLAT